MNLKEIGQGERISLSGSLGVHKANLIRCAFIFVLALVILNLSTPSHAEASTMQFADIKGHWAESTIYAMVKEGVLEGFPDGTFRPNDPVQVDQFIKMILMALSEEHDTGRRYWKESFLEKTDVYTFNTLTNGSFGFDFKNALNDYWAQPFIEQAMNMTILDRNDRRWNDNYSEKLTREDVAFIGLRSTQLFEEEEEYNYLNLAKGQIKDLLLVKHDESDILQVYMKGIMNGYSDGTFGVNQLVTRAEAAAILMRIIDKQKRIPYQPDLSGLPYAVVPTEFGDEKTIVFPSWDMYRAYDILKNNLDKSEGFTTQVSNKFLYYKDEQTYLEDMNRLSSVNTAFGSTPLHELLIITDTGTNSYNFFIQKGEEALARHRISISFFLQQIFDNEASSFYKNVEEKVATIRDGSFEQTSVTISGRRVNFLRSNDQEFLYIFITQK